MTVVHNDTHTNASSSEIYMLVRFRLLIVFLVLIKLSVYLCVILEHFVFVLVFLCWVD